MRIGIDARSITARSTGPGIYAEALIRHLVAMDDPHRYLLFWSRRDRDIEPFGPRVEEISVARRARGKIEQVRFEQLRVPALVRRYGLDLWFTPTFFLPLRKNCLQVTTIHDLIWLLMPREFSLTRRLTYSRLLGLSARQADHVLTVSEASKSDLVQILGLDPERITVTYNAPAPAFRRIESAPGDAAELAALGIRGPYFVYQSGMLPRKNILRLLDAFAVFLRRSGLEQQLVITGHDCQGQGRFADEVARRLGSPILRPRVVRTGYLPASRLALILNHATASIYPSLYEGFGFPVVEAMACGAPVITSNVSSMPEVAGGAALLIDPRRVEQIAAAMLRIATDGALRTDLRRRGLENVRRFSWSRTARQVHAIFGELGERGRARQGRQRPAGRRLARAA